ncbi:hypothetical protein DV736_g6121, partial [Chaetothyriales sp. CBS 134916]
MTADISRAGLETFDSLNIDYEHAYRNNAFKIACVKKAILMLLSGSRVLDVGCGTGIPVSQMLSEAGLEVIGFDISPKMVDLATSRVKGTFSVSDMLSFQPTDQFAGIFMIFAHLQLNYTSFREAVYKFASALQPGGVFVVGQMPSDRYVPKGDQAYDPTGVYVEDYPAPFMGEPLPTFMMSAAGQRELLTSMGLEIVSETIDLFQPDNPKCEPEEQQYIIAVRKGDQPLEEPRPLPRS